MPYLKLHHGLLHALYIKDHLDQLLDRFGQLGLGASRCRQLPHCLLVLPTKKHMTQCGICTFPFFFSFFFTQGMRVPVHSQSLMGRTYLDI